MNIPLRQAADRLFTTLALLAVLVILAALVAVLAPILWRGTGATLFQGTVEFRRMQMQQFNRGQPAALRQEVEQTAQVRRQLYDMLDEFSAGLDTTQLASRVKQAYRDVSAQLANRALPNERLQELRDQSKLLRDGLLKALETDDKAAGLAALKAVLAHEPDEGLKDTAATAYFTLARQYQTTLERVDLGQRGEFTKSLGEIREGLQALLGPRPGEHLPAVVKDQYGATRWDQALQQLDHLLYTERWERADGQASLQKRRVPRQAAFAGTSMERFFPYLRDNLRPMLNPRVTFYWQYFIDDNLCGHYFGGVGPEIWGTLLVTLLAIAFALPLGVITAGYLVECAGDTHATRILRTCINTLAGVPSIVFGLFGLAFFVLYLGPLLGMPRGPNILAGSMTLALLVLPVMIRASEEAIRTVPGSYKEAALSLGAGKLRCFVSVTLPVALPGILTGLILSMSRAAGETAPILFTAAVAMGPIAKSLFQQTRTLSYSSYDMAVGDKMAALAPHNQFGMVMTLVGIVLVLNIMAIILRGRLSRRLRGN